MEVQNARFTMLHSVDGKNELDMLRDVCDSKLLLHMNLYALCTAFYTLVCLGDSHY